MIKKGYHRVQLWSKLQTLGGFSKNFYNHLKFKITENCLNDEIPKEAKIFRKGSLTKYPYSKQNQ